MLMGLVERIPVARNYNGFLPLAHIGMIEAVIIVCKTRTRECVTTALLIR